MTDVVQFGMFPPVIDPAVFILLAFSNVQSLGQRSPTGSRSDVFEKITLFLDVIGRGS